jgi:hypothetical protein
MDGQIVEILGHNQLTSELFRAGLEVSLPVRDRGIDLIAYADLFTNVQAFVARPIQMKAASNRSSGLDQKYAKFPNLLIAYVWHLDRPEAVVTFALTYDEAFRVAQKMGYTETPSWEQGNYVTNKPGVKLRDGLEPYRMTSDKWWKRVTRGA